MGKKAKNSKKNIMLQEEKELTIKDVVFKVQKLEGYIKKAERRVKSNEKKLERLRKELRSEIKSIKTRLMA
jgi:predicted  nucleic acid-binding Zn-ribbon protein